MSLVKLTENDKRFLLAFVLLFLLIFVIIGFIGLLIERIMKFQAKRASQMMNKVVRAGVITKPKHFRVFGLKKNTRLFFKQSWIPFLIMTVGSIVFLIYAATRNFDIDLLDYNKKGFTTILFLWNNDAPTTDFFGMTIISGWPSLKNTPHFEAEAWGTYVFGISMIVGGVWFLVLVQAFISRQIKIWKLSKTVFSGNLDNFNIDSLEPIKTTDKKEEDKNINPPPTQQ